MRMGPVWEDTGGVTGGDIGGAGPGSRDAGGSA